MNTPAHKQIEVQIMGQSYLLTCPAGGEASLLDAVERVDTAMCRIRDAGKVKARDRIAVLASLNLAFELAQKERQPAQASPDTPPPDTAPRLGEGAGAGSAHAEFDTASQARIDEIMRRLDQALDTDGQLL